MRDRKIKVLFVIHSLSGGGAERVLSYILNALSRDWFDISVLTFSSRKDYNIPDDVGGRYSVLTPAGLLPVAIAGFDIEKLISGFRVARQEFLSTPSISKNNAKNVDK